MRPSRLVIVGLAVLCALHVFMLAGHGSSHHHSTGGMASDAQPADAMTVAPLAAPMTPDDHGSTGMDMTVACLAVVAGLLLLRPRRAERPAIKEPDRRTAIALPARPQPSALQTRTLEELCISLT